MWPPVLMFAIVLPDEQNPTRNGLHPEHDAE
jgi:hypothetical protein